MPVTDVTTDRETLTLTITAEFAAPVQRVWDLYADPRQLEQVWGPPQYPATFVDHALAPGSRSTYFMTSPEGERFAGWWLITTVDEPSSFAFDDGFADDDFNPVDTAPVSHSVYTFSDADGAPGSTTAVFTSTYDSADDLQTVLDMGVVEGASSAINQIDGLLASDAG